MKKMAMLGDPAVGKTSLVKRFVYDMFEEKYMVTLGAKVVKKEIEIEGTELKFMIWDLLGQDTFDNLVSSMMKGVDGAFLVFDLTRENTLDRLPKLVDILYDGAGEVPIIFLGNKYDLKDDIEVTEEEIEDVISQYDSNYYKTSAKTGKNVEDAFCLLGEKMLKED